MSKKDKIAILQIILRLRIELIVLAQCLKMKRGSTNFPPLFPVRKQGV